MTRLGAVQFLVGISVLSKDHLFRRHPPHPPMGQVAGWERKRERKKSHFSFGRDPLLVRGLKACSRIRRWEVGRDMLIGR